MSKKLDNLIENSVKAMSENVFKDEHNEENGVAFIDAVRTKLKEEIYEEVKAEIKDKAIEEAESEIYRRNVLRRVNEYRKLMIHGFFVAIFVGLFVNQATDMVGVIKGSYDIKYIGYTVAFALLFLAICVIAFAWLFISDLIRLLQKEVGDETN